MSESFDPYHVWLGIPPKDQPPHYYRLLAIEPFENDSTVVEYAADQRMVHLRTMQNGEFVDLAQRLLNEIAAARVTLLNPEKKAAYDARLSQSLCCPPPIPSFRTEETISEGQQGVDVLVGAPSIAAGISLSTPPPLGQRKARYVTVSVWQAAVALLILLSIPAAAWLTFVRHTPESRDGRQEEIGTSDLSGSPSSDPIVHVAPQDSHSRSDLSSQVSSPIADEHTAGPPEVHSTEGTKTWDLPELRESVTSELGMPVGQPMPPPTLATAPPAEPEPRSLPHQIRQNTAIVLPSGETLPADLMDKPADWEEQLDANPSRYADAEARRVCTLESRGVLASVHFDADGLLHRQAIVVGDSRLILALYEHGQREGGLRVWSQGWSPLLYARYSRGQKHGLACLYRQSAPWLVAEYEAGSIVRAYLHDDTGLKPIDAGHEAISQLALLEKAIDEQEMTTKQRLRQWYRDQVESERQELAAKLSAQKRDRMTSRIQQRSADNAARTSASFGSALRSSGF